MADSEKKGRLRRGAEKARAAASDFAAEQRQYHSAEAKQDRAEQIRHQPIALAAVYLGGVAELAEGGSVKIVLSQDGIHADTIGYWWPQITELAIEDASTFGDRITATRVAFLGPLPLGFRKKTARTSAFLTVGTTGGPLMFELKGQTVHESQRRLAKAEKWRTAAATAPDETAATPAGWYPNPEKPGEKRWWDGKQWPDQTR